MPSESMRAELLSPREQESGVGGAVRYKSVRRMPRDADVLVTRNWLNKPKPGRRTLKRAFRADSRNWLAN